MAGTMRKIQLFSFSADIGQWLPVGTKKGNDPTTFVMATLASTSKHTQRNNLDASVKHSWFRDNARYIARLALNVRNMHMLLRMVKATFASSTVTNMLLLTSRTNL